MNTKNNLQLLIERIYDYIIEVTIKQDKLLPVNLLYGDGTRWNKDKHTFKTVYFAIKESLIENNLLKE